VAAITKSWQGSRRWPDVPDLSAGVCAVIDTASDIAGVAVFQDGVLLAETAWRTRQSHSRQLLPALEWLLEQVERQKHDITSLVVCLGPGSYAGMRVGLSTAKALAYALEVPLVGIGRLAADALAPAEATLARVVAVQAAGRADLAYAAYLWAEGDLQEVIGPRLGAAKVVVEALEPGDVVCGEIDRLDVPTLDAISARGCRLLASTSPRAVSAGLLGLRRLSRGEIDNPDALVPLYLRAPAIGPQPPR
jgi:tRNA threonylcarbamoyl adenosine modification protein YeaZ